MKHFRLFAILLLLVCGWTTVAHGQTQEPAINLEFTDIPLSEAISRIEKSSKYTFFYDAKQTDLTRRVSLRAKQLPISAALRQMLAPTGLNFTISERQIALIPAARKAPAGSRTITGTVNDSHELPLAGVAVTLEGDNTRGTVSENNGCFTNRYQSKYQKYSMDNCFKFVMTFSHIKAPFRRRFTNIANL